MLYHISTIVLFSVDHSLFRSNTWHVLSPKLGSRRISSGELSSVLRPFYFAVHPGIEKIASNHLCATTAWQMLCFSDLFGQHPEQRVRNRITYCEMSVWYINNLLFNFFFVAEDERRIFETSERLFGISAKSQLEHIS